MSSALIGYTGFVGSNLLESMDFDFKYNSKNIQDIKGKEFDFLVCAGIPAEMFVANSNPEQDKKNIQDILNIVTTVKSKTAVLISTVAVYPQPVTADENSIEFDTKTAYGKHRRMAEEQFAEIFPQHLIVRLPALFGHNIKKNFLFDIMNPSPSFLNSEKLEELSIQAPIIKEYYSFNEQKNLYQFERNKALDDNIIQKLNDIFYQLNFTSLQFTNFLSQFQFYNLSNLYNDIHKALEHGISNLNICSEPLTPHAIIKELFNREFDMNTGKQFEYDMKSIHASLWGNEKYLYSKKQIVEELRIFFKEYGVL